MFEFFIKGEDRTYLVRLLPKPFIEEHKLWNPKKGKSETTQVPNWARAYRMLYAYVKAKVKAIAATNNLKARIHAFMQNPKKS